jgi:hypothetical protein
VWCSKYFQPLKGYRFPVRLPEDEQGNLLVNEEDRNIFGAALPGDHLVCHFQCELWHFQNLQGRSPMEGAGKLGDTELLKCLRRVNLDAFWSQEPSIISHNLGKVNRVLHIAHELGMSDPSIPNMIPWELNDEFGAGVAVIMVSVMKDTVKYETVRRMKSAFVKKMMRQLKIRIRRSLGGGGYLC